MHGQRLQNIVLDKLHEPAAERVWEWRLGGRGYDRHRWGWAFSRPSGGNGMGIATRVRVLMVPRPAAITGHHNKITPA